MSSVISVQNLSKKYIIGHQKQESYTTLRDSIANGARRLADRLTHPFTVEESDFTHEEFWALKDVSFDIQQGDRVGIIGGNGAGKSTLLKVLSRITEPTTGQVKIKGRVASLLEVGTGFHPELTGRENIYLNGAILGMSKVEIKSKFDEIVAFAEIERFLDTPVKRYSSGMYVRLAFAVAAHLEPEILIVDEVLAVGDAQFQKKCMGKMESVGNEGRTILFVSHNMGAINTLCNKGILLQKGQVMTNGAVEKVLVQYMQRSVSGTGHQYVNIEAIKPDSKAVVLSACVLDSHDKPSPSIFVDQNFFVRLEWRLNIHVPFLRVGIEIMDSTGVIVLSSMDTDITDLHGKPREPGLFNEVVRIPSFILMPGNYTIKAFAGIPGIERIMEVENLMEFEVVDNHTHHSHVVGARRSGYIGTPLQWEVKFKHA